MKLDEKALNKFSRQNAALGKPSNPNPHLPYYSPFSLKPFSWRRKCPPHRKMYSVEAIFD